MHPDQVFHRNRLILKVLQQAGGPVHVREIGQRIGLSESGASAWMLRHGDDLWMPGKNLSWWRALTLVCWKDLPK